jgi:hypothetical protein
MKSARGAGSGGKVWVGAGRLDMVLIDAVLLAQPPTQIDLPATRTAERKLGPFSRIPFHLAPANRAVRAIHRLHLSQTFDHS